MDEKRHRLIQNPAGSPPILDTSTLEVECLESNQAKRRHIHDELNSEHNRCRKPNIAPCIGVAFRSSAVARTCLSFPVFVCVDSDPWTEGLISYWNIRELRVLYLTEISVNWESYILLKYPWTESLISYWNICELRILYLTEISVNWESYILLKFAGTLKVSVEA
jgi:hypothetical protein